MPVRRWDKETFARCFPTLTTPGGTVATGGATPQGTELVALINAISLANTALANNTSANNTSATTLASTNPQDKQDKSKQMSRGDLLTLLQMCGKASTGELADLPAWLRECSSKGTTEPYRIMIVQKYVMANTFFEYAYGPMTSQPLKMIMKRSWTGTDENINCLSLVHDIDGLSPFTMLDLNEDEVALINDEQNLLNTDSLVRLEDLKLPQRKHNICYPIEADDFMLMLKRYGNLVYAVFFTRAHSLRRLER